ncbi:Protein PLASTID REDOX INSENSITIVE 2, chloroplastic [Linum grandiflorum]
MAVPFTGHLHSLPPHPLPFSPAKSQVFSTSSSPRRHIISHLLSGVRFSPAASSRNVAGASSTAQKYVYPDPDPDFARRETQKFRSELRKRLVKEKHTFGEALEQVVKVCSEIFSCFLHKEYGGPGTLMVEPFTDMFLALKEKKLPGAPSAARAALLWAQNHVDQDWQVWHSDLPPPR